MSDLSTGVDSTVTAPAESPPAPDAAGSPPAASTSTAPAETAPSSPTIARGTIVTYDGQRAVVIDVLQRLDDAGNVVQTVAELGLFAGRFDAIPLEDLETD